MQRQSFIIVSNKTTSIASSMCLFLLWPLLPMVQWKMGCLPRPHLVAFYKQSFGVAMFHQLPSFHQRPSYRPKCLHIGFADQIHLRSGTTKAVGKECANCMWPAEYICPLGSFRMGSCSSCQRLDTSALENLAFCSIFNVFSSGFNIVVSSLHVMDSGMTLEVGDSESVCKCRQKWVVLYIYVVFFNHGSLTKLAPRQVSFVT